MTGLSLGPITGKLLVEVLTSENPSIDIGMLSPDPFYEMKNFEFRIENFRKDELLNSSFEIQIRNSLRMRRT